MRRDEGARERGRGLLNDNSNSNAPALISAVALADVFECGVSRSIQSFNYSTSEKASAGIRFVWANMGECGNGGQSFLKGPAYGNWALGKNWRNICPDNSFCSVFKFLL